MSYSRSFKKEITVHYSGDTSYPASEHGGRTSYHGSTTETIVFDVFIDTDPFDSEIHDMKGHVDVLTGSVVATEAAHVKVIRDTTKQIGDTIISGFFKTVRSDVSQQIAELKNKTEALLLQLNKLAQRCRDKKRQMGVDYARIADRYSSIFSDLNHELENRIYSIDEPVFHAVRTMDSIGTMTGGSDSVTTVTVSFGENAHVHSMIATNLAKRQAAEAIDKGKKFLTTQYVTDSVIKKCLHLGGEEQLLFTPYCVMDATDSKGTWTRQIFTSELLGNVNHETLFEKIDEKGWDARPADSDVKAITAYFNSTVAQALSSAVDEHDRRVANLTARMFDLSNTAIPGK